MSCENDVLTFDMMKEAFHKLEKFNKEPKWVMAMPEYVEIEHVLYADSVQGAAAIMENARESGAVEVRAEWMDKDKVYRVAYKTKGGDSE